MRFEVPSEIVESELTLARRMERELEVARRGRVGAWSEAERKEHVAKLEKRLAEGRERKKRITAALDEEERLLERQIKECRQGLREKTPGEVKSGRADRKKE
jgi:hypothetical protein